MDTFVKRFFPHHENPGASFKSDGNLCFCTYSRNLMKSTMNGDLPSGSRSYVAVQKMTAAGRMEISLEGGNYLVNHTPLLFNLLRFAFLLKLRDSNGGSLDCKLGLGDYYDEVSGRDMRVDMDSYWFWPSVGDDYNEKSTWAPAPGVVDGDYPCYRHVVDEDDDIDETDAPTVDLRSLSEEEAIIVLMMLGTWKRRSRARLDASMPKLTDVVYYRHSVAVAADLNKWQWTSTADLVWCTLKKYVKHNRLYGEFSVALFALSFMAYQFLPATARSCVWLGLDWVMCLPKFTSWTGLSGKPNPYIQRTPVVVRCNRRVLSEWSFFSGGGLEKVNLLAILIAQAHQTGCAVRAIRKGLREIDSEDLYRSETDFYLASSFASASVAEAIKPHPFPMPGMLDVRLHCSRRFDAYHHNLTVTATYKCKSEEEDNNHNVVVSLPVGWIPFSGSPVLLLPLNPFPYNSPLTLKGTLISKELGTFNPRGRGGSGGFCVNPANAWLITNIANLCGYDVGCSLLTNGGPIKFVSPSNDVHLVWPVTFGEDEDDDDDSHLSLILQSTEEREQVFIPLPSLHNKFFAGVKNIEFSTVILARGVCVDNYSPPSGREDITEYSGHCVRMVKQSATESCDGVTLTPFGEFISRVEMGFRKVYH